MSEEKRPNRGEAKPRAAAAPPQRPKPPVVGVELVTTRCGHAVPFELFEPRFDKFRNDRRKKLADQECRDCRMKVQAAKEKADQEAARLRRREQAKEAPPASKPQERLPHGSRFDVSYDANKAEWSGTLTVPGAAPGDEARTFTGSASAVFKLLHALDRMYRAAAGGEAAGAPTDPATPA